MRPNLIKIDRLQFPNPTDSFWSKLLCGSKRDPILVHATQYHKMRVASCDLTQILNVVQFYQNYCMSQRVTQFVDMRPKFLTCDPISSTATKLAKIWQILITIHMRQKKFKCAPNHQNQYSFNSIKFDFLAPSESFC